MKLIPTAVSLLALQAVCLADGAPPNRPDLLSRRTNLDIPGGRWVLSDGVVSNATAASPDNAIVLVKKGTVKVPSWYALGCRLVNITRLNERLPHAGLLFGVRDRKNYWSVTIGQEWSRAVVALTQVKDGKMASRTLVPITLSPDQTEVSLGVEVRHYDYIKVVVNRSRVLTHELSTGIAQGQIGIISVGGRCGFADLSLSGIAKH